MASPIIDTNESTTAPTPVGPIVIQLESRPVSMEIASQDTTSAISGSSSHSTEGDEHLSDSFALLATHIHNASKAISGIPPLPDSHFAVIHSRLDRIEENQKRLEEELRDVLSRLPDKEKEGPGGEEEKVKMGDFKTLQAALLLEQQRLPARLHNALCTVSKMAIKAPVLATGKTPANFPSTRGEFEHLTKERYEALLKAYSVPYSGDTASKRDTLRAFLGLPADSK